MVWVFADAIAGCSRLSVCDRARLKCGIATEPASMPKPAGKSQAKSRTAYVCTECGADYAKWQGQCEACGAWDALSFWLAKVPYSCCT